MSGYRQVQYHEREIIYSGIVRSESMRKIAKKLGRSPSTISREFRRNKDNIGYFPAIAEAIAKKRKNNNRSKIERDALLKNYIIENLQKKWSPIAIAGRLEIDYPRKSITPEAIYQYIYNPKNTVLALFKLLPRVKRKRGIVRKAKSTGGIPNRVSIDLRPREINQRKDFGHFEGDLLFHKGSQSANVLTLIERKSRYSFAFKNESKTSEKIIESIIKALKAIAQTITFDNGKEFAAHTSLMQRASIKTYFCYPGSPWQKGSIEHFNGMTRRHIPFKVSSYLVTQSMLDSMVETINHTPRKILNFKTPCEVFNQNLQTENRRCCT